MKGRAGHCASEAEALRSPQLLSSVCEPDRSQGGGVFLPTSTVRPETLPGPVSRFPAERLRLPGRCPRSPLPHFTGSKAEPEGVSSLGETENSGWWCWEASGPFLPGGWAHRQSTAGPRQGVRGSQEGPGPQDSCWASQPRTSSLRAMWCAQVWGWILRYRVSRGGSRVFITGVKASAFPWKTFAWPS